jgi:hypothetical protein
VFINDSGLLHALLHLRTMADLEGHPKVGASWEGFVLGEIIRWLNAEPEKRLFWATKQTKTSAIPISLRPASPQYSGRLSPIAVMQPTEDRLTDHSTHVPTLDRPPLRRVLAQPEVRP